jgi:type 1 glutamine amidotransferase
MIIPDKIYSTFFVLACAISLAAAPTPIKVLLVIGGCCEDYITQRETLKNGIEKRAYASVTIAFLPQTAKDYKDSYFLNSRYADSYDIVVNSICYSQVLDTNFINSALAPYKKGKPSVLLHCSFHTFGKASIPAWSAFCGIRSTAHGDMQPIALSYLDTLHPITRGLPEWTSIPEELYNNEKGLWPTAYPLARGKQGSASAVICATNEYQGARVFGLSLGHHNETVADNRYLNLVTRGLLWACDKLNNTFWKAGDLPDSYTSVTIGRVTPEGSEDAIVRIYSLSGKLKFCYNSSFSIVKPLSLGDKPWNKLTNGIYLYSVESTSGAILHKGRVIIPE